MPQRAGRSNWLLLLTLAAIWGASYLFIKVAVRDLEPTVMMFARALIAAALLIPYLAVTVGSRSAVSQLRGAWREVVVLGAIVLSSLPYASAAIYSQLRVRSGVLRRPTREAAGAIARGR
jgi:drug/metabolite transporter (DMT)-like permease